jgi:hypothetical protein
MMMAILASYVLAVVLGGVVLAVVLAVLRDVVIGSVLAVLTMHAPGARAMRLL